MFETEFFPTFERAPIAYKGNNPTLARHALESSYASHSLAPLAQCARFSAEIKTLRLNDLQLVYHHFPYGAKIFSTSSPDFHLLQFVGRGAAHCIVNNEVVATSQPNQPTLLTSGVDRELISCQDTVTLDILVPDYKIRANLELWCGKKLVSLAPYCPCVNTANASNASSLNAVLGMLYLLDANEQSTNISSISNSIETVIIWSLLFSMPDNLTYALPDAGATLIQHKIGAVEDYIHAHYMESIDAKTLADIACCSTSTLYRNFKRARGHSPMELLRRLRLERAQHMLRDTNNQLSVSAVAMECGFYHMGRFSAYYRNLFGEAPSQTLARARPH